MRAAYASTACLEEPRSLWEILDAYAAAGIAAVELGATKLDTAHDLAERLRARGLAYTVHNYFPPPADPFVLNLASPDTEDADRSSAFVEDALELAAELEAPFYAVHGGFASSPSGSDAFGFAFRRAPDTDTAARRYEERIAPLAERARTLGVRLLVENNVCTEQNRGGLLHQTAEELQELLGAVPALGLLVDTGHLNVTARTFGFDREAFVRTLAPHIAAFHVHDNDGVVDLHLPVEDGSWAVPLLRELQVPLVVEARFRGAAELAAHLAWLERATAPD